MPNTSLKWGGALPSHLTKAQAARLLGVSRSAVGQRCRAGTLPLEGILGVHMIPTLAVLQDLGVPSPVASTPAAILSIASRAEQLIAGDAGDNPEFSALELAGVYLGLSRLPWPTPSPEVPYA